MAVATVPSWMSYEEVAARLRISRSTVRRLVRRGELQSVPIGGRRRILTLSYLYYAWNTLGSEHK
jgi:excisionase family DNA binding protein